MSYALKHPCNDCKLGRECSDKAFLEGAVWGIHQVPPDGGHKGAGVIRLECQNKEPEGVVKE